MHLRRIDIQAIVLFLFAISFSYSQGPGIGQSQDLSGLWEGHFSFMNIVDVVQGNNRVYVAAENVVFVYDTQTSQIQEITTIEGLSGENITTLHYSIAQELLIIGYENGLIEIYLENTSTVFSIVDIIEEQRISPNDKRINHFNEFNNDIYIAADYGISVYNLERLEFGDTFFIGNNGEQIIVTQTAIFGNRIFASCFDASGVRTALVNNDNLIDFNQWTEIRSGNFDGIETVEDRLYVIQANRFIFEIEADNSFTNLFRYDSRPSDIKSSNNNLVITLDDEVFIYDSDFNLLANPTVIPEFETEFTSAVTTDEGIYIGTNSLGVLRSTIENPVGYTEIRPDGPLMNNTFAIEAGPSNVWASYGDYTFDLNPSPFRQFGVSHLVQEEWINIPFDSVFGLRNLNEITINPENQNQVFISSFEDGLLEINNNIPTMRFDETNSGLESIDFPGLPNFRTVRVAGTAFDRNGLLWSITSLIQRPLKYFDSNNNIWRSFDFLDLIANPIFDNLGFVDLVIDNNNTKWIGSFSLGLIAFNETLGGQPALQNIPEEGVEGSPSRTIRALALDQNSQLWIGTSVGLRVLFNTSTDFFTRDDIRTEPIIILDDGIPRELLGEQFVSDIEVDGSNNKWVATIGSGAFLFSPDGQETIFQFTEDNSPLPSNNVNDISLDRSNGIVYFATDRGLVSFIAGGSSPEEDLESAFVYPNPVRPSFDTVNERIKIQGISENVNIKITDVTGNLVAEAESRSNRRFQGFNLEIDGGTALWNGRNLANNNVRSGVYLILLTDLDTQETRPLKLLIIR